MTQPQNNSECQHFESAAVDYMDEIARAYSEELAKSALEEATQSGRLVANESDVYYAALMIAQARPTYIKSPHNLETKTQ